MALEGDVVDKKRRSASTIEQAVTDLSDAIVREAGLYLEDVKYQPQTGQLQIIVDLPHGAGAVDANQLAVVSRAISTALDEQDPISRAYTLEISTPGATRQLKTARHFDRAQGRLVMIKTVTGERISGRVVQADSQQVTLFDTAGSQTTLRLDNIAKAVCQVELNRHEQ